MDFLHEKSVRLEALMDVIGECLANGQTVKFMPKGTSMLPMLRQGKDSVILAPLPEQLKLYDIPLYRRKNGQYVLHRIVKTGATYTCMGDNQFEPEENVEKEQMLAVVTGFVRDGREHSVKEWSYQIYCRGWHYSRWVRRIFRHGRNLISRMKRKTG